jgi:hypothetical protein
MLNKLVLEYGIYSVLGGINSGLQNQNSAINNLTSTDLFRE